MSAKEGVDQKQITYANYVLDKPFKGVFGNPTQKAYTVNIKVETKDPKNKEAFNLPTAVCRGPYKFKTEFEALEFVRKDIKKLKVKDSVLKVSIKNLN